VTLEELSTALDAIQTEAFRLEARQSYAGVPDPGWEAWQADRPLPHRSPDNDWWLARVVQHVTAGRRVYRAMIIDWPLSEYKRYELAAFAPHPPAGEGIYVVDRDAHPGLANLTEDYWMLDERLVVRMPFDQEGRPLGLLDPDEPLAAYIARRDLAMAHATPLDAWLADHRERLSA
jgi:hypothetical protein